MSTAEASPRAIALRAECDNASWRGLVANHIAFVANHDSRPPVVPLLQLLIQDE